MARLINIFQIFSLITIIGCNFRSDKILSGHNQLLVVTTLDWEASRGVLQLYERSDSNPTWVSVGDSIPVLVGKAGLGWGIGLHPALPEMLPRKVEGDQKSPAGIFSLGSAFGFAPIAEAGPLKVEYRALDEHTEAVDDPQSLYYNHIVSSKDTAPDWRSSEKMGEEPFYAIGMVVNHNFPNPQAGAGSAIFLHIWKEDDFGTAGCTAMSQENLTRVLRWLDSRHNPILVQLPILQYRELEDRWALPKLAHPL